MTRRILLACAIISAVCWAFPAACLEIKLKYASFDPLVSLPEVPTGLASPLTDLGKHDYLVQFDHPITMTDKDALAELDAEILDYIPDFTLVARFTRDKLAQARGLPRVRWIGPFHPAYKISPLLRGRKGTLEVSILMRRRSDAAGLVADIARQGGRADASGRTDGPPHLRATIPDRLVERIAKNSGVSWIELFVPQRLTNNVARGLMGVLQAWSPAGLFGAGEIVAVCDTGLDTGNTSTLSADFTGRVLNHYNLGRNNKWDDPNGHGTHVSGSVVGSGVLSGSNPATHSYASSFAGVAPEARLVIQSVLDNSGGLRGIPSDLNSLFLPAYNDGARVHTNSWGSVVNGYYSVDSHNVDTFTWNHKDMVVLFSTGNSGVDANSNGVVDLDSIESPATAKNCISVGASESNRPAGGAQGTYGGYWPSDFPANPIKSDKVSNNPDGIVAFSSRGPTNDGRIKPDVVAPGTNIVSCRSHAGGAGTLWGAYDSNYSYSGGTSMSTPLTAGVCALLREYYRVVESHSPSSALIKASLINGSTDLYPGQYGTGSSREIPSARPNNVEGWGLVNAAYLINRPAGRDLDYVDDSTGLSTDQSASYSYYVAGGSEPLRVTLAWTDYPAATAATTTLVNDLDLTVTLPGGSVLRGNGTTDRTNNVEGIDIDTPAGGFYLVTVKGYNAPFGPQPFALVVSGELADPISVATIGDAKASPDGTTIVLGGKLVSASPSDFADTLYIEEPNRTSGLRVSLGATTTNAVRGNAVTVTGTLQTIDGERVITNPTVIVTSPAP